MPSLSLKWHFFFIYLEIKGAVFGTQIKMEFFYNVFLFVYPGVGSLLDIRI